jgi:hypothetical protein
MGTSENARKYYCPDWLMQSGIIDSEERFSTRITDCLDRYWCIVTKGKQEVKQIFTDKEFTAIVAAMLSHAWTDRAEYLDREILPNIEDSTPQEINLETEEEKKAIEEKLKKLPYHLHIALVEMIRNYWIEEGKGQPL